MFGSNLFSLKVAEGVKAGSCCFNAWASSVFPCTIRARISVTGALYLSDAIQLERIINDTSSTGVAKFLNMVHAAILQFFSSVRKIVTFFCCELHSQLPTDLFHRRRIAGYAATRHPVLPA